ncbi:MAG: hypothetical protein HQM09_17915 [Candidatus Riflebacteria bacterium]|nr:hypothetical protein [Candidatus Riflebacteria bacterium]
MASFRTSAITLFFAGLAAATCATTAGSGWSVSYGQAVDQVGYDNASLHQNYEDAPYGPMAFRVHNGELWLLDSTRGRILAYAPDGKQKYNLTLPGVATNTLLEDLALVPAPDGTVGSIWVGDGADLFIRHIRVSDGAELARIGKAKGHFQQIHQIEVGPSGRLYVGDFGRSTISVFSPDGTLLREQPWERSGFVIGPDDRLSTIDFSSNDGYFLRSYDATGKLLQSVHLGQASAQNPRLWRVDTEGALVSFIPPSGYHGLIQLVRFGPAGQIRSRSLVRPAAMNRFLDPTADGGAWRALADFSVAPKGSFEIRMLPGNGDR